MQALIAVLGAVLVVGYPVAVWFGLPRIGTRGVALVLLATVLARTLLALRTRRTQVLAVLRLPLAVGALALVSVAVDDARFILAMPALSNVVMLATFASTLKNATPMVERFARMQVDDLTPAEVRYCRTVTVVWCAFFVLNALACALLAAFAPLAWWTVYTGAVSYALAGCVFAVEYLVRKYRFRRYGAGVHDRVFAFVMPRRAGDP